MPDLLPRDLELRSPRDLRTGRLAAFGDTLVGLAAGSGLCLMINHPPFGTRTANPSVWILLPIAIGTRHGELPGLLAGLCAWGMHWGLLAGRHTSSFDLVSGFLFMLAGATAGFLSGAMRDIAGEELEKHRVVRRAIHKANATLRMAARFRDDLVLELARARSGGSAVAPHLRRVALAAKERRRDEMLEYLESVHEVRSSAVYRNMGRDEWILVTSRGAHPDGEYASRLVTGLSMARTAGLSGEAVFCGNPKGETGLPPVVAPLFSDDDGVREIVVVTDITAERLTARETLGVATAIEFLGIAIAEGESAEADRLDESADALLRLHRICGVESTLAVFEANFQGETAAFDLAKQFPGSRTGALVCAGGSPSVLIAGEHPTRIGRALAELRRLYPETLRLDAGFDEAPDDTLSAAEWIESRLAGDHWCI